MLFAEPHPEQRAAQASPFQVVTGDNPGAVNVVSERRSEPRVGLNVAALVVPLDGDVPDISRTFAAITRDMSSKGIGVIANRFLVAPDVLICLWNDGELRLLRAAVRHRKEISRGWVRFGVEIIRTTEKNEFLQLRRFLGSLLGCS